MLKKDFKDENGYITETVYMNHDYYHLVDKTQKKVELFNKGEELRMNMTKRMFNILVDEEVYDVDDVVDVDDEEEEKVEEQQYRK